MGVPGARFALGATHSSALPCSTNTAPLAQVRHRSDPTPRKQARATQEPRPRLNRQCVSDAAQGSKLGGDGEPGPLRLTEAERTGQQHGLAHSASRGADVLYRKVLRDYSAEPQLHHARVARQSSEQMFNSSVYSGCPLAEDDEYTKVGDTRIGAPQARRLPSALRARRSTLTTQGTVEGTQEVRPRTR